MLGFNFKSRYVREIKLGYYSLRDCKNEQKREKSFKSLKVEKEGVDISKH